MKIEIKYFGFQLKFWNILIFCQNQLDTIQLFKLTSLYPEVRN